jgi:hypothetical protein
MCREGVIDMHSNAVLAWLVIEESRDSDSGAFGTFGAGMLAEKASWWQLEVDFENIDV